MSDDDRLVLTADQEVCRVELPHLSSHRAKKVADVARRTGDAEQVADTIRQELMLQDRVLQAAVRIVQAAQS